jgi:hypothetical protein
MCPLRGVNHPPLFDCLPRLLFRRYSAFNEQEDACDAAPGSCAQKQPADYFDSDYAKYQARCASCATALHCAVAVTLTDSCARW